MRNRAMLFSVMFLCCRLDAQLTDDHSGPTSSVTLTLQGQSNSRRSIADEPQTRIANELSAFLKAEIAKDAFSGVVLVAKSGMPVFEHAYGFCDRDKRISNQLDTKFDLGSMPKMFTAIAIAQLAEAGRPPAAPFQPLAIC